MQDDFPPLPPSPPPSPALRVVETAFLASTAALIWILSYTPLAPFMRLFFPIPVALAVMRWDPRTGAMALVVSALLLTVLMGPTRSILYVIPYGLLGYCCACLWRQRLSWYLSLVSGAALSTFGLVFQLLLSSLLLGENLWTYLTIQLTGLTNWLLDMSLGRFGLYWVAEPWMVQGVVLGFIAFNSLVYAFTVHLVAALVMEHFRCPLPPPPKWVQFLLD
ncbi:DUF2232 domain-containing protein [Synechococcus sp. H70.2]|uniref:DUF2232 domain-containing protein n=1 Tax=unclassified Synechococcus TaxID=2626047 RepID=UPI0039C38E5A